MQILSPLPGSFYRKPSPDDEVFKKSGDKVEVGDVIGLVEVMKSFIEIKSEVSGIFKDYVAEDGSLISPGFVLAELES